MGAALTVSLSLARSVLRAFTTLSGGGASPDFLGVLAILSNAVALLFAALSGGLVLATGRTILGLVRAEKGLIAFTAAGFAFAAAGFAFAGFAFAAAFFVDRFDSRLGVVLAAALSFLLAAFLATLPFFLLFPSIYCLIPSWHIFHI